MKKLPLTNVLKNPQLVGDLNLSDGIYVLTKKLNGLYKKPKPLLTLLNLLLQLALIKMIPEKPMKNSTKFWVEMIYLTKL